MRAVPRWETVEAAIGLGKGQMGLGGTEWQGFEAVEFV